MPGETSYDCTTDPADITGCGYMLRQRPARKCRNGLCASCRMYRLALECTVIAAAFGPVHAIFAARIACAFVQALKLVGTGSIMVNFPGRNDRRRRVLKEEVRSASASRATLRAAVADDAPRYSDAAGVENHPQITDFVPRRYSTIALLGMFGVAASATTAALHYFALPMAASRGINSSAAFDLAARGNLNEWLAAVVLFIASA